MSWLAKASLDPERQVRYPLSAEESIPSSAGVLELGPAAEAAGETPVEGDVPSPMRGDQPVPRSEDTE
jgi:hypothetical protein